LLAAAVYGHAQWVNYPTPGIPKTRDGKPNLSASAPRASDGRPDLSGLWQVEPTPLAEMTRLFGDGSLFRVVRHGAADWKAADGQIDLFADFNGVPEGNAKTEFYQHDANWSHRMILGDSLQVMASLAEREGLRGQVQCIYIDPP
jgi:hypothetical protein